MANTDLNALSTYADDSQHEVLKKAAARENRSLSNYLLTAGVDRAKRQHGLLKHDLGEVKYADRISD